MRIKQIVATGKVMLGLGEDDMMYFWANEKGWLTYGWEIEPTDPILQEKIKNQFREREYPDPRNSSR